jgi:Domain of unknown function (DUF4406)
MLMLDGWEDSAGVQAEIRIAREFGRPVRYLAAEEAFVAPTLAHVAFRGRVEPNPRSPAVRRGGRWASRRGAVAAIAT